MPVKVIVSVHPEINRFSEDSSANKIAIMSHKEGLFTCIRSVVHSFKALSGSLVFSSIKFLSETDDIVNENWPVFMTESEIANLDELDLDYDKLTLNLQTAVVAFFKEIGVVLPKEKWK